MGANAETNVYYTIYALVIAAANEKPEIRISVRRDELESAKRELVQQGYADDDGDNAEGDIGYVWIEEHEVALWRTRSKAGMPAKNLHLIRVMESGPDQREFAVKAPEEPAVDGSITLDRFAANMGLSPRTLRRSAKSGSLKTFIGEDRRMRIRPEDAHDWISRHRYAGNNPAPLPPYTAPPAP